MIANQIKRAFSTNIELEAFINSIEAQSDELGDTAEGTEKQAQEL